MYLDNAIGIIVRWKKNELHGWNWHHKKFLKIILWAGRRGGGGVTSWMLVSEGLGFPNDPQKPCWLRLWLRPSHKCITANVILESPTQVITKLIYGKNLANPISARRLAPVRRKLAVGRPPHWWITRVKQGPKKPVTELAPLPMNKWMSLIMCRQKETFFVPFYFQHHLLVQCDYYRHFVHWKAHAHAWLSTGCTVNLFGACQ